MRVGLVLGGGGLAGKAFHAGVLTALEESTGWVPGRAEVVVGTSAGSSFAALFRHGVTGHDLFDFITGRATGATTPFPDSVLGRFGPIWDGLGALPALSLRTFLGVPPPAALRHATALTRGRAGVARLAANAIRSGQLDVRTYVQPLHDLFGTVWPADDTLVCAVRKADGRRVVFGDTHRADVASAVAASSAIPGYFAPVAIDGADFVDGGLHSPTNADVLAGRRLDLVIVSAPMSTRRSCWSVPTGQPVRRLARALLDREIDALRREGAEVLVFHPGAAVQEAMGLDLMAVERTAAIARLARRAAGTQLARHHRTGGSLLALSR